jgi:hypothetical protein
MIWNRIPISEWISQMAGPGSLRAELGTYVCAWLDVTVWKEGDMRFHVFSHQAMSAGRGPIVQLVSPRMRHRVQMTRKLDGWGSLTAVYFSNEWLIELDCGDWTENRLVPAGLTFAVTKQVAGVFLKLTL